MVLRSRSHCHFSGRLQLTGPVTENRSLNQLTQGEVGWGLGRKPARDQRLNQRNSKLSVFTDAHEEATEITRLDKFIGSLPKDKKKKSPEYTSVDFCHSNQVRTTKLSK